MPRRDPAGPCGPQPTNEYPHARYRCVKRSDGASLPPEGQQNHRGFSGPVLPRVVGRLSGSGTNLRDSGQLAGAYPSRPARGLGTPTDPLAVVSPSQLAHRTEPRRRPAVEFASVIDSNRSAPDLRLMVQPHREGMAQTAPGGDPPPSLGG